MNKCLFYDKTLQKIVPCTVVPNKMYTINGDRFCKIVYDDTLFNTYNTNYEELYRYSTDQIDIFDLYPANTQEEIDYAIECIPNKIALDHKNKELLRFEKIVNMLTDVDELNIDFFYKIADFLSYDLLFFYLNQNERVFMLTISTYPFNAQSILTIYGGIIPIHPFLRSVIRIFDKFNTDSTTYYIQNIRNLAEFSYITFPLQLNIPVLKSNIQMLRDNNMI